MPIHLVYKSRRNTYSVVTVPDGFDVSKVTEEWGPDQFPPDVVTTHMSFATKVEADAERDAREARDR